MDTIRTCISFLASSAAKSIARLARERLSPFGVTPIQFAVLQAVSEAEGGTASDIGTTLSIDSATIVGVIDRLEACGLVRRERSGRDRRIHRLVLTDDGSRRLPEMRAAMDGLNAEIDAALGGAAQTARASLTRLSALTRTMKGP